MDPKDKVTLVKATEADAIARLNVETDFLVESGVIEPGTQVFRVGGHAVPGMLTRESIDLICFGKVADYAPNPFYLVSPREGGAVYTRHVTEGDRTTKRAVVTVFDPQHKNAYESAMQARQLVGLLLTNMKLFSYLYAFKESARDFEVEKYQIQKQKVLHYIVSNFL